MKSFGFALRVGALAVGVRLYGLLDPETPTWFETGLDWLLVFAGSVVVIRIIGLYVFEVLLESQRGMRLPPLLPPVILGTTYMVTAFVSLKVFYPDLPMTSLVGASAVTSLVLGLALQPILGNFFAGIVISVERPFRLNDWIRLDDMEAQVQQITWRTTHLRTRDNDNLVVPNAEMSSTKIINYFYPHPLHMERVYVGVHYRTPPYRVEEALLAAAASTKGVLEKPTTECFLIEFGDSSILYELRAWIEDFGSKPRIVSDIKKHIWEEFDRRGIVIPFPIRTLEIEPRVGVLEVAQVSAEELATRRGARDVRLFVADGPNRGLSIALTDHAVTVGRDPACDLTLSEREASKQHLRVEPRESSWVLIDQQSTHGTLVNGRKVTEHVLSNLDRIKLGNSELVFEQRGN